MEVVGDVGCFELGEPPRLVVVSSSSAPLAVFETCGKRGFRQWQGAMTSDVRSPASSDHRMERPAAATGCGGGNTSVPRPPGGQQAEHPPDGSGIPSSAPQVVQATW